MAGYSRAYFIGGQGGYMGADGVNPLVLEILEGHSDRQWFEAVYVAQGVAPLGSIRVVVPRGPEDPDALLDACLAFFPEHFDTCATMKAVRSEIGSVQRLDFAAPDDGIPASWAPLREEARSLYHMLSIWVADLRPLQDGV